MEPLIYFRICHGTPVNKNLKTRKTSKKIKYLVISSAEEPERWSQAFSLEPELEPFQTFLVEPELELQNIYQLQY